MTFTDNYRDSYYNGSAVTLGPGVQGFGILETSAAAGKIVVTGDCPTVGVAGGYTQGGGHSALSTSFGLAADQTLSMEVVTASGACVTASRSQNSDLYWAFSGGGAGNFGVVTSMTIKTYPDAPIGGGTLFFAVATTTPDIFWQAVTKYYELLPAMIDSGITVVHYITSTYFNIGVVTGYNKTSAQVQAALAPFEAVLTSLAVPFSSSYGQSAGYYDHFQKYLGPLPEGTLPAETYQFGSRLMTRAAIKANNTAIQPVLRNITNSGVVIIGVTLDVSSPTKSGLVSNSVLPAWRETLVHTYLAAPVAPSSPFADLVAVNAQITNTILPLLDSVIPHSYSYMNEGNFQEPNWKEVFYGANYAKLLTIKKKYDPNSLFYNLKGVNSDVWTVSANWRMCKA
jgi:FAD/FMN-containing dehydrogenase